MLDISPNAFTKGALSQLTFFFVVQTGLKITHKEFQKGPIQLHEYNISYFEGQQARSTNLQAGLIIIFDFLLCLDCYS